MQYLTQKEKEQFEPMAKVLAANGIAQSLSFSSERKYLEDISSVSTPFHMELMTKHEDLPSTPLWLRISQVGRPVEDSAEKCFTAIQKILTTCFMPRKAQLIFVVSGKGGVYSMYLGIRSLSKDDVDTTFIDGLGDFIKGIWPGTKCERVRGNLDDIRRDIDTNYDYIDALTGIPSMQSQYKTLYPATLDVLFAGMQKKDFAYMVIADPIPAIDIDSALYKIRDFNGQAESLKSFNFSENTSEGMSKALSESKTICDGINKGRTSKGNFAAAGKTIGAGLMLASYLFPPAGAITTAIAVGAGAYQMAGAKLFSEFTPTYSQGSSHSESTTQGETNTTSYSLGKAISSNIVNKQIEAVSEHLFYQANRLETGKAIGCWSVGVYLMAEKPQDLLEASMQIKSIVSGQESIYEPVRVHRIEDVVDNALAQTIGYMNNPIIKMRSADGVLFEHPLGSLFNDLRTVLTTKELSYFINFPLRSVPGIGVIDSMPDFSLTEEKYDAERPVIKFGKLLYGGSVTSMGFEIPIDQLSRHTLISGINGTGKTNTVQSLLNGIGNTPFLVIEPAKTEYVDWAIEYNRTHENNQIDIYIPGCNKYRGSFIPKRLRLNPFQMIWLESNQEPNVLAHIDRLKSTFASAFPMYDILPVLMEDLIYTVYQNKTTNWLTEVPKYGITRYPTLNGMKASVDKVLNSRGYEQRVEQNLKACLNTRIDSLMRGWKGDVLNTNETTNWRSIFEKPCLINLSYVGDDVDKGFFMSLILQFLYEYRQSIAELGKVDFNDNSCKHLTIIEEAHRIMAKCDNPELPQYKSAMMFSNMLSEIRAYGEGLMLVDQVPTRLIPDAIKNTSLKITHRLVAEDDQKAMAESMGLTKEQRQIIPKLLTGQCVISSSLSTEVHWVKVNKVK